MPSANVLDLKLDNWDYLVLESELPVLVEFAMAEIRLSKEQSAIVDQFADENVGKVTVGRVDLNDDRPIVEHYRVSSVPTVIVIREGRKTAEHVGLASRDRLTKMVGR